MCASPSTLTTKVNWRFPSSVSTEPRSNWRGASVTTVVFLSAVLHSGAAQEPLDLWQWLPGLVQVLRRGDAPLLDELVLEQVREVEVGGLDAEVVDEDRPPFVARVRLQKDVLDVEDGVEDA